LNYARTILTLPNPLKSCKNSIVFNRMIHIGAQVFAAPASRGNFSDLDSTQNAGGMPALRKSAISRRAATNEPNDTWGQE